MSITTDGNNTIASRDAWRLWRLLAENAELPRPYQLEIDSRGRVTLRVDDRTAAEAWAEILSVDVIRSLPEHLDSDNDHWQALGNARISWEGRDELVAVLVTAFTPKVRV